MVRWAPVKIFSLLVVLNDDVEKAEVVVLACISVACLLRVGEAATVHTSERGDPRFNRGKLWPCICCVEVGRWTRCRRLFLLEIWQLAHGRAHLPFSFEDANGL